MKFFNLIIILSLSFGLAIGQEQVDNGDFETWSDNNNAPPWTSYNYLFGSTAEKTSDSYHGDFAVRMETADLFGEKIPGFISLGNINTESFMPTGGIPFSSRPTGISLYYKYQPAETDTMLVFAALTKWNSAENQTDTIGLTGFFSGDNKTEYSKLQLPFAYFSEETPDTINIGFLSSFMNPKAGSTLFVDSLTINYGEVQSPTVALPAMELSSSSFLASWLPIPYADGFVVDVASDELFSDYLTGYEAFDVGFAESTQIQADCGLYFYRVNTLYGENDGGWSNTVPVAMPTQINEASNITPEGFSLTWIPCQQASDYLLDLSTEPDFSAYTNGYENYSTAGSNTIDISGLQQDRTYYLRIKTLYPGFESPESELYQVSTASSSSTDVSSVRIAIHGKRVNILNNSQTSFYELYNRHGQMLRSGYSNSFTINENGIYFIRIRTKKNTLVKKVFISE